MGIAESPCRLTRSVGSQILRRWDSRWGFSQRSWYGLTCSIQRKLGRMELNSWESSGDISRRGSLTVRAALPHTDGWGPLGRCKRYASLTWVTVASIIRGNWPPNAIPLARESASNYASSARDDQAIGRAARTFAVWGSEKDNSGHDEEEMRLWEFCPVVRKII